MSESVFWLLEGAIKTGALHDFMTVMKEMVAHTHATEPDALNYEWFVSEDQKTCYIYERYASSAAVLKHVQNGAELFQRLVACVNITGIKVFGNPNDEVKRMLSGLGAACMKSIGGFVR